MYGGVEVTLLSEEHLADFVIRTMRIRKPGVMVKRKVKKVNLVPRTPAPVANDQDARSERFRMLEEDEDDDDPSHVSTDRFRASNRSLRFSLSTKFLGETDSIRTARPSVRSTTSTNRTIKTIVSSLKGGGSSKKASCSAGSGDTEFEKVEYEEEFEEEDVRVIYQLHYNNWSSHTTPFPNSILAFRRRVRLYMNEVMQDEGDRVGPTLVHCR